MNSAQRMGENKKKSCKLANPKIRKAKQKSVANILNQIETCNLPRCLQKRKKLGRHGKGKSVSTNITEQQMDIDQEAIGIQFEEEMILEILSRLPVQSLLRFKCISKFWKALISDSYFKMKHLNHAKNDQDSQKILVSRWCADEDEGYNFYCSSLSSVLLVEDEQKLDCPSTCKRVRSIICCSCDGLVLLSVTDRLGKQLLLWNPSTRESVVLPHPDYAPSYLVWGLGYDATSDDYKILAINLHPSDSHEIFGQILALKSGIWRKTCEYPSGVRRVCDIWDSSVGSLAFVHGAFHWLGFSQCYTVFSFNISNEQYGEIPFPKRICHTPIFFNRYTDLGISVLGGMLCFYSTYCTWQTVVFKLCVMKDYGVEGSWIDSLTVIDPNLFHSARPKYMFAEGEVLLCCSGLKCSSSVYMISRGRFRLGPQCVTHKQGIVYTKSLISPKLLI